jgi:hypothetical protein
LKLSEDNNAQRGIVKILETTYGKQAKIFGVVPALIDRLGDVEVDTAIAALDAHITDTTDENGQTVGHWMPKAADILAHVKRLVEVERKRQAGVRQSAPMGDGSRVIQVPRVVFNNRGGVTMNGTKNATSWPNKCRECADRGIARFVYDPNDMSRVWLASEALELPDAILWRLKYSDAVCDCPQAYHRPESGWRVVKWCGNHGGDVDIPVFPQMRTIKALAAKRRAVEAVQATAPAPVMAMVGETF